jgi:uncharacterized membrane protein YphA (DoxX/SURF4 family)
MNILKQEKIMIRIILGIFFVLHGLVHLLYTGQSVRAFELQPGMTWPDGSWLFSKLIGNAAARNLASVLLIMAAVGFVAAGAGVFLKAAWWRAAAVGAAVFSGLIYVVFWDGGWQYLDNKGGIGILINLAILAAVLVFRWPEFNF